MRTILISRYRTNDLELKHKIGIFTPIWLRNMMISKHILQYLNTNIYIIQFSKDNKRVNLYGVCLQVYVLQPESCKYTLLLLMNKSISLQLALCTKNNKTAWKTLGLVSRAFSFEHKYIRHSSCCSCTRYYWHNRYIRWNNRVLCIIVFRNSSSRTLLTNTHIHTLTPSSHCQSKPHHGTI